MRASKNPAGTTGAAGCPEHSAPEQGRGGRGLGIPADSPARSWTKGSNSDESRPGSVREVTRCEQPPSAPGGASKTDARSNTTAPAGRETSCWRAEDLVIRRGVGASGQAEQAPLRLGRDGTHQIGMRRSTMKPITTLHAPPINCKHLVAFREGNPVGARAGSQSRASVPSPFLGVLEAGCDSAYSSEDGSACIEGSGRLR